MEYEITTIKDIFDKIPRERVADCMDELKRLLIHAHDIYSFTDSLLSDLEVPLGKKAFPDKLVWKDDGKKLITTRVSFNGNPMFGTEIKLK